MGCFRALRCKWNASTISQYFIISLNILPFFSNSLDILQTFNIFQLQGWFWLCVTGVSVFPKRWRPWKLSENLLPYISKGYHMYYLLYYHFMGILSHTSCTNFISSLLDVLLHALPYTFCEINTYLY